MDAVDAAAVAPGELDAIVVPTFRPGSHLTAAMEAASDVDCPVLCLCSGQSRPADVIAVADSLGAQAIAIDTTQALSRVLPRLSTTRLIDDSGFGRGTDLSGKRNLALLISRAMNWNKVLFLDDDIQKVDPTDLRALAGLLDDYDAVGLGNTGFPDNSVVCHAYREIGGDQETFVSGGLLSVRVDRLDGHFPDIYNEDWFFLHSADGIARTGTAFQDKYDPFDTPARARDEELGDVLAEGVYWLRDEGESPDLAHDEDFWEEFLCGRRKLIEQVARGVMAISYGEPDHLNRRLASLAAARAIHSLITPDLCTSLLLAWDDDRATWLDHRSRLDPAATVEDCLRQLERRHSPNTRTDWTTRVHRSA